jgi:hypothetical protein
MFWLIDLTIICKRGIWAKAHPKRQPMPMRPARTSRSKNMTEKIVGIGPESFSGLVDYIAGGTP